MISSIGENESMIISANDNELQYKWLKIMSLDKNDYQWEALMIISIDKKRQWQIALVKRARGNKFICW